MKLADLANGTAWSLDRAFHFARVSQAVGRDPVTAKAMVAVLGYGDCRVIDAGNFQALVAVADDVVTIAFRGTRPDKVSDWFTDSGCCRIEAFGGRVHRGFLQGFHLLEVELAAVDKSLGQSNRSIWITGHSLGGALATLLAAQLVDVAREPHGIYTFGCPRVGTAPFAARLDSALGDRHFRVIHATDIVPRLPPRRLQFRDQGTPICLGLDGQLHTDEGYWLSVLNSPSPTALDLLKVEWQAIADHSLDLYLSTLEQLLVAQPIAKG